MHPETKKLTHIKHSLSNTNTDRKSKATTKCCVGIGKGRAS